MYIYIADDAHISAVASIHSKHILYFSSSLTS